MKSTWFIVASIYPFPLAGPMLTVEFRMHFSTRDALKAQGFTGEASIAGFPDFEHLEFKGQERVGPFLDAMKRLVEEERAKAEPETE